MRYRLRADVKSDAPVVMIFVKGYAQFQGRFRKYYQCYKNVKPATGQWATWERTFCPSRSLSGAIPFMRTGRSCHGHD